ncbi:MAG: BspA family leucine-rich repeat surface protein, partial [Spirochaetota bacterium]
PNSKEALLAEINARLKDPGRGAVGDIDTSLITDMSGLFEGNATFNADISKWDTSNVTNMARMFRGATAFNQPVNTRSHVVKGLAATKTGAASSGWDTSRVKNMSEMFAGAISFNQAIGAWNTSKVANMESMFEDAAAFNQPLENWKTAELTTMAKMFKGAQKFDRPISRWESPKVADVHSMFEGARFFKQPLKTWKLPKLAEPRNAENMLKGSAISKSEAEESLTQSLSPEVKKKAVESLPAKLPGRPQGLQITGVTKNSLSLRWDAVSQAESYKIYYSANQNFRFSDAAIAATSNIKHTVSGLNPNTHYYFQVVASKSGNYVDTDPSSVDAPTLQGPLTGRPRNKIELIEEIKKIYTGYAENTDENATASLNGIDTSLITDMSGLFKDKEYFNGAIDQWDTAEVTNMSQMFSHAYAFNQNINTDGNKWNTAKVTNMSQMFNRATAFNGNISNWDTASVINMQGMFQNATVFNQKIKKNGDIWNTASVTNMQN